MFRMLKILLTLVAVITGCSTCCADLFRGLVLDEASEPLVGAIIRAKGLNISTTSDANGGFSLEIPGKSVVAVVVSYVGYLPREEILRSDKGVKYNEVVMTLDPTSLDEVVVTATRTPKALKDVPVITRVINAEDIKKTDATNVQDLLVEELPGLEFGYAMTQETSLNMSGFGGSSILFLVDGERLAGETMDNVDYNRLTMENVGQVEIVKGASSALYGANAVGGVVNLITRESKDPWRVNVNSRYGSFGNEWRAGGVADFNSKHWNSSTTLQYHTSETVQLAGPFDILSTIHQVYGGTSWNVKERLIYRVNDSLRFVARGGYFYRVSNRANYDDHFHDYSGGLKSVWLIDPSQNLEVSYSYDQYDKTRYVLGRRTHNHDYTNRQNIVHALYNKFWGLNGLTLGADFMHDHLSTYQFADNSSHRQTSVDAFAQFDYNPLKWLNVVASVRDDYYSASRHNAVTTRLAFMFKPSPLTVRLSYSGGFRAPTLKEMYMDFDMAGIQMIYGNPDLKPERSHNVNLSVERAGKIGGDVLNGSYTLTAMGYFNYYDRRITIADVPDYDPENPATMYVNESGVKVTGLDLVGRYVSAVGLGATVSYNYYHTPGRTLDSQFIQQRPHSATWKLDYDKQLCSAWRIYAALSGRYLGSTRNDYPNHGSYTLWKFTLQQTLWRGVNVNFAIDNLFNYKPKVFYWNSPLTLGTSFNIGVTLDINELF